MRIDTGVGGRLVLGATLVLATASAAGAQGRELFHWSGRVDQEIRLTMSGRSVTAANIGPREPGQRHLNVLSAIPRADGEITVQVLNGRGTADVIQQPTAANGYTTTIRIQDPQSGVGDYSLNVFWHPAAAGEVGPPIRRGPGAASRVALHWSGDVDDNLELVLRPGGVNYRAISGRDPRGISSTFNGIPAGATRLDVIQTEGRGSVVVTQQPTAENGYTARLQIHDPQPGYGHYSFDVRWR